MIYESKMRYMIILDWDSNEHIWCGVTAYLKLASHIFALPRWFFWPIASSCGSSKRRSVEVKAVRLLCMCPWFVIRIRPDRSSHLDVGTCTSLLLNTWKESSQAQRWQHDALRHADKTRKIWSLTLYYLNKSLARYGYLYSVPLEIKTIKINQ